MFNLEKIVADIPLALQKKIGIENEQQLKPVRSLVVCGMGGSGIIGDLIRVISPHTDLTVHKSYGLPENSPPEALYLVISYSGRTEEALSSYEQVLEEKKPLAVIAGGGEFLERARADKVSLVPIEYQEGIPARFKVGSLLRAALEIMEAAGFIASIESLVGPVVEARASQEKAQELALALKDSTVLVYAPEALLGLAEVWKTNLNETAKLPAFANSITETLHNEIETIGAIERPFILLLDDPQSDERIGERFRALEKLAESRGWPKRTISLAHRERIVDLLETIMLSLLTGLKIASERGIDPLETPLINELKR